MPQKSVSWEWQILQEWQSPTTPSHRHHSWEWEIKLPHSDGNASPEKFLEGEARYEILERLGKGTFGEVCAARDLKLREDVAVKRISDAFASYVCAKRTLREVRLLRLLDRHDNLIEMRTILPISMASYVYKRFHSKKYTCYRSAFANGRLCGF